MTSPDNIRFLGELLKEYVARRRYREADLSEWLRRKSFSGYLLEGGCVDYFGGTGGLFGVACELTTTLEVDPEEFVAAAASDVAAH